MATEYATEVWRARHRREGMRERLRLMAIAVPAAALLGSILATPLAPQAGILAAAFVLGWTQLVGL